MGNKVGVADLPLHPGRCPPWLFKRMKVLAGLISENIVYEYGTEEFVKRLSNPYFFQSLGCVLGFDWHSSGVTTTTLGALKEAIDPEKLGVAVLGGKGGASRKTPDEIERMSMIFPITEEETEFLKHSSRMAAKVDSAAVQDGYQLYHHNFVLDDKGNWCVIQQGMNDQNKYARRYHWLSEHVLSRSFVNEPHTAICCDHRGKSLNMVSSESAEARKCSLDLVKDNPEKVSKYLLMHSHHWIDKSVFAKLMDLHEFQPRNYEELLAFQGVGPKTIRALALTSKLIYGTEASWQDPAQFSFAHGGKDGTPRPVDLPVYSETIEILENAIKQAKLSKKEQTNAIKRLQYFNAIK